MSAVLVRTEPDEPFQLACTRGTALLGDGYLLTIVVRDDVDGTYEFRVSNSGRTAFDTGVTGDDLESEYFSFCVDESDNVHIVYTKKGTKEMRYCKFTKDVGVHEWTGTGSESVGTLVTSEWGRRDIDVLSDGTVVILASRVNRTTTPDTPSVILYVRTAAGAWSSTWSDGTDPLSGADAFATMVCTVARDLAGISGGYTKVMVGYQLSATAVFRSIRIKVADGTLDQIVTVKSILPDGAYARTYGVLFSTGNNEWVFGGTQGHANGASGKKMLCFKMSSTAVLGEASPVKSQDYVGGNYYTSLPAAQMMGTGSDGRLVVFSPRISSSTAETGLYHQVCRIVGNTLTWRGQGVFQKNIGATFIRAGANRNLSTRWCDVVTSRTSDHKTNYAKLDAPAAPTGVAPAAGSTVATSRPVLVATLPASQGMVRGQWQTATDTGFTTSVKTTLEPETDLRVSGTTNEVPTLGNALVPQGGFYVRAAAVNEFGVLGTYSGANSFTVSHPPSASMLSPTGDVSRPPGSFLQWEFTDAYVNDSQTAFQVIVELNSDGSVVLDTGKVVSTETEFGIGSLLDANFDDVLRWKVKLWDADDVDGAFSAYHVFRVQEPAEVVIVEPSADPVENPAPAVEWTFTASAGRTQVKYQIVVTNEDTNQVKFTSPLLSGDDLIYEFTGPVLDNETNYTITVLTVDSRGITASGSVSFLASWVPPESVPFTVDAWHSQILDYVPVLWDNSEQDEAFVGYRLYRRNLGSATVEMIYETDALATEYEYHDWIVPVNIPVEWALVQVALRFGVEVESVKVWVQGTPISDKYWLLHPTDTTLHTCLWHVTGDDFSEEYDEEIVNLINRGRKVDRGTRYGVAGALAASLIDRETETGHYQRLKLDYLRALGVEMWLRTPFGDLWKVIPGQMDYSRTPGVGTRDFSTVSIPYTEVS